MTGEKEYKLNHLLFMDDLKLFVKSKKQMDALVRTVLVFSTGIGMKFGKKKCGILTMKREKVVKCEEIKLQNCEKMKEVETEGCKYLSIVELDKIKDNEIKEKTLKEYRQRLGLVLKSKLNWKIKINT